MRFGEKLMRFSWESLTIFIFSWESHEILMSTHENFCKGMGKVPLSTSFLKSRDACRKLVPPWRHALVSGCHLDPKKTRNSGSGAVRAGKRWLSLGVVVPTLINQYRMRYVGLRETILDPNSSLGRVMPRVTSCSIPPGGLSRKRIRTDRKDFYHVPQHHKP